MFRRVMRLAAFAATVGAMSSGCATSGRLPAGTSWTPASWAGEDTIVLRSDCPKQGEHWFPVWLVVLDGELYVRLGSRAADRLQCTRGMPLLGVRIGGRQFDQVRSTAVPELAENVAAAMAEKYWTDVFVRGVSHPLTLRLAVDAAGGAGAADQR
jgi:hypothetical protein